jgi:tRNA(Ile2) C34 agmatinyltransferase TiaS
MQRCPVCNGRTILAEAGYKCMNSSCEGSRLEPQAEQDEPICRCGEKMTYSGEDSWGMRNFLCIHCGATKREER